ncbi:uncharacterized protein N7503_002331 [Penicillium pulvis]|uniref:uncharacterized protein n=1 Tax=Penicillium pulvis TaxID=1562058 RepID=UPI002547C125|nr:uncharacterized protein N7503_002331 [Penicillium pulvis]KAJ5810113.1 hypothetical protein N7503_002331 [Penicillium pulvis]
MSGDHDRIPKDRGRKSRDPITQNISGVSAESGGKVFAGYVDNSINSEYYGGTHYHWHPDPTESPPSPLSTVPFRHDPDFVSRDGLLDQIHEKSSIPGSTLVLYGIGGVGKSRLAIEYCYRVQHESPNTWIFWVHASNAARCELSLRELAERAKIPGRQSRHANIFQLFRDWLQDGKIGKWLLVLDNVDDDELLHKPLANGTGAQDAQDRAPMQPPLKYLLEASNGSIIVTSRNKAVALEIAGYKKYLIDVQPMNEAEALDLMQYKLDSGVERADLVQLVEELEFMPLAIVQAASYIVHCSPRCSASQYLEKLRHSDRQATTLLSHEGIHMGRDWEAKNSILLTWQISFDHIRRVRQSAADLLSLMSFFDWQGIPEDLLRIQYTAKNHGVLGSSGVANKSSGEDTESSSEYDQDETFESDITTLRDYSFVTASEHYPMSSGHGMVFTMHRLVQLTARTWLKTYGQDEEWKERFIDSLYAEFPTGQYEHRERCRTLFPHVKSAMSHRPKSHDCLRSWAGLLYKGAWYAQECGNLPDLREMASMSREQRLKVLGLEDKETLDSTIMLAVAYRREGNWREAEQLFIQVLETRKSKLGADHLDTLTSMANLALTFWNQGRWEEAEQLLKQVMETHKTKLGTSHPSTLTSMSNLASTFWKQGRWEEAEQLELQVMETSKEKLGADHPSTLTVMANLASTFWNQGRLEEAEKLEVQVMETSKAKLGADHPSTLTRMANLASTYRNQGRLEDAEQLDVQIMEASKTKLGADHPTTLTIMANLASTFWNQGRLGEAEKLEVQVMETRKTKLGADHPSTLTIMANLALTFRNQGRLEEAEKLEVQVMEASKAKLGADHPDTLTSMANLASTFWKQGRLEEAEQLLMQVMETSKTKLGADHPDTLESMNNLAYALWSTDQEKAALPLMAECARLCEQKLGPDHPNTMSSKSTLNEWRGKAHPTSSSSQLTKAPTESKVDQILSTEVSKRVPRPGGHHRRTIRQRLFGRK